MRVTGRQASALAALLGLVAVGVTTVALGYWSSPGGGSGSAVTAATHVVTLSPATPATQLYPGGQAAVAMTATNPGAADSRIESLALDTSQGQGGFAVDASHSACGVESLSFATQTNGGVGWDVPGGSSVAITLPDALAMATSAANACQGAVITVYLEAGS